MARVKRGVEANRRHKKILKQAKGYYGARSRVYRVAVQAVPVPFSHLRAHQTVPELVCPLPP